MMIHMMLCPGGLISRPIYQASLDNLQKPNPGNIQKGYCMKKKFSKERNVLSESTVITDYDGRTKLEVVGRPTIDPSSIFGRRHPKKNENSQPQLFNFAGLRYKYGKSMN